MLHCRCRRGASVCDVLLPYQLAPFTGQREGGNVTNGVHIRRTGLQVLVYLREQYKSEHTRYEHVMKVCAHNSQRILSRLSGSRQCR